MQRTARTWLVLVVWGACGGGSSPSTDAAVDVPIDQPVPPGPVSIVVEADGPLADVLVYFQESDGTLVAAARTDATGRAMAILHSQAFVSVVGGFPDDSELHVRTFSAVTPGESLLLRRPARAPAQATVDVQTTAFAGPSATYRLNASCPSTHGAAVVANGEVTIRAALDGACLPTADLLVYADDANGLQGSVFADNAPITNNGGVDLRALPVVAASNHRIELFALPPAMSRVVRDRLITDDGDLYVATQGLAAGDTATWTHAMPVHAAMASAIEVDLVDPAATRTMIAEGPYASTTSIAGDFLPIATNCPTLDRGSRALFWSLDPFARAEILESAPPPNDVEIASVQIAGSNASGAWSWTVFGPPSPTYVRFPRLPAEAAIDLDGEGLRLHSLLLAKSPTGYTEARARWPHDSLGRDLGTASVLVQGGAGSDCSTQPL